MKRYFCLLLFTISFNGFSQYTMNKGAVKNKEIIEHIEKLYKVHFFYDDTWLEGFELENFQVNNNLDSLLKITFNNTPLSYYKYQSKYILLIPRRQRIFEESYGQVKASESESVQYSSIDINDINEEIKQQENKIIKIGSPGESNKIVQLTGNVSEIISSQNIEGVAVFIDEGKIGTTTNRDGNFKIMIPAGFHTLQYRHVSMEPVKRLVEIYSDGSINTKMIQKNTQLKEVRILGEDEKKEREYIGFEMLKLKDIDELPTFMGEVDIIKHSLLLPGIQSVGEADMSFSVRGGKGDQNLILIEGIHTYSYSHFFGFFSGINSNSLNKANLYKAAIPTEYGNSISSVYDISVKSGDLKKFNVDGGISPISGGIVISGPVVKDKMTFLVGGRTTYSNYIFDKIDATLFNSSSASFSDYQIKLNNNISEKSSISLFYYKSNDVFSLNRETSFSFDNELGSLNWRYSPNEKTHVSTVFGFTNFKSQKKHLPNEELSSYKEQKITDFKLKTNILYDLSNTHSLSFGIDLLNQSIKPWSLYNYGKNSIIQDNILLKDKGLLGSLFVNDNIRLTDKLGLNIGLRYVMYFKLGPFEKYNYENNKILAKYIVDTTYYKNNQLVDFDHNLDVRISATYKIGNNQNLNFGYNRNNQFIHLLTNSQGVTPTDSWRLSNEYIKHQTGNQISLGYNVDFFKNKYFASFDIYYKKIKNLKDFINGSEFEFNPHPETEIVNGEGKSYGVEVLLRKNVGRISGILSYTYSRTFVQSQSDLLEKIVNNGEYYPASNDKPHNLSIVLNLKPSRRLTLSNTVNYSSGAPITLPVSKIYFSNGTSIIYSDRNEYRMPYYFRWDVSLSYKGSLKKKRYNSTWVLSIYNVTSRKNAYSIYHTINNDNIQGYKLSIIGEAIPTLTYKFNF